MLNLSPEETIVTQFPDKTVTLTTHRISHRYHALGSYHEQHIPLEDITACETYQHSHPWLLLLAGLVPVAGVIIEAEARWIPIAGGVAAALACYAFYLLTRKAYVIVRSATTTMAINVKGVNKEWVESFVSMLGQARDLSGLEISTGGLATRQVAG